MDLVKPVVGRPFRGVENWIVRRVFERGLHDTTRPVLLEDLDLAAPGRRRYEPSRYGQLGRALRGERIGPGDVFVDYGSGKGRVLVQAARRPFGRVIGVELSEELNRIARENVARARERLRCGEVEVVTADVTEWPLPDEVSHIYMYNPVGGELLEQVVDRIVESLDRRPRRLVVMYANAVSPEVFESTGRFALARTSRGVRRDLDNRVIKVYVSRCP